MLAKRIIPCLDVKDGWVVKGVRFKDHVVQGEIEKLAQLYSDQGADELVFYDITASSENRVVDKSWVGKVASLINIPFCVAGGIRSVEEARVILNSGADKISINSPALENPLIIEKLVHEFGSQCVVVGIDSYGDDQDYWVMQYTGSEKTILNTKRKTTDWVKEVQSRGAGEIVLNCMNQDGVRKGYDLDQLIRINDLCQVPLIASGGAGAPEHFKDVFTKAHVSGALAASVFHSQQIQIPDLKKYLKLHQIEVRL